MGQVLIRNERFSDFYEGWIPFLLEIKQKAGWLVGIIMACVCVCECVCVCVRACVCVCVHACTSGVCMHVSYIP